MAPSTQSKLQAGDPVIVNERTGRILPYRPPAPGREPHPGRDDPLKHSADGWVAGMAEHYKDVCPPNLWRIHGQLYDFTDYLDTHPGGRIFLEQTMGSDCTEAFECHHVRGVNKKLLEKHRVPTPASISPEKVKQHVDRFTYDESFREIKNFVAEYLKNELRNPTGATPHWAGVIYLAVVLQFLLVFREAARRKSFFLATLAGFLLTGCWGVGHNQVHRGRYTFWNLLRYAMDLTSFSAYETTVTHALSHHQNPNTWYDIEVYQFQTLGLYWLTNEPKTSAGYFKKGAFYVLAGVTGPFLVVTRLLQRIFLEKLNVFQSDVIIPTAMVAYMCRKAGVKKGIALAMTMWYAFAAYFVPMSLTAHHSMDWETGAPRSYHDGEDDMERDFAAHQILSTLDHSVGLNDYLSLTLFAHLNVHTVHHLFPTIDRVFHRKILNALLEKNPGKFREIHERRDKQNKNFLTDLWPSVFKFAMERRFERV